MSQPPPDDEVESIALEVEQYVSLHPTAADTPQGIARWWLTDHGAAAMSDVEAALELLVQRGRLQRHELPDGNTLYSNARRASPGAVQPN